MSFSLSRIMHNLIIAATLLLLFLGCMHAMFLEAASEAEPAFIQSQNAENVLVVDRIEGAFAVCECRDGKMLDKKLSELPSGVAEGDFLCQTNGQWRIYKSNPADNRNMVGKEAQKLWD